LKFFNGLPYKKFFNRLFGARIYQNQRLLEKVERILSGVIKVADTKRTPA